jgi:hypothetical protein
VRLSSQVSTVGHYQSATSMKTFVSFISYNGPGLYSEAIVLAQLSAFREETCLVSTWLVLNTRFQTKQSLCKLKLW